MAGLSVFAVVAIIVGLLILSFCLMIAPLMIWKHLRRTADALENISMSLGDITSRMPKPEKAARLTVERSH